MVLLIILINKKDLFIDIFSITLIFLISFGYGKTHLNKYLMTEKYAIYLIYFTHINLYIYINTKNSLIAFLPK